MEPESNVCDVQSEAWEEYFRPDLTAREGQAELWKACADAPPRAKLFAVLPTGYGKTIAACGAFAIFRERGLATHMLVLVPSDLQREQWVAVAKENFERLGVKMRGVLKVEKKDREFRYALPGGCEVFVASYQSLGQDDEGYWRRLMAHGRWLVVFDECHRLAEDNSWAAGTAVLPRAVELYLSATPIRTDRRPLIGVPSRAVDGGWEFVPTVRVSVARALKERAIRWPVLHKHHYFVDVSKVDGTTERLTTESLAPEAVSNFDAYETRYQLRYRDEYLSTMLTDSIHEWRARDLRHPGQHQMLVFAMTCRHAEFVSAVLNKLAGEDDFADWIGVSGKSQSENEAALGRYLANRLRCLVQVEKAGEGFDNKRSSVLVFLNLIRSATRTAQQVGRGARRNPAIANFDDDTFAVFASADSSQAAYVQNIEDEFFDTIREKRPGPGPGGEGGPGGLIPLPSINVISAEFDRAERFGPEGIRADDVEAGREVAKSVARATGVPMPDLTLAQLAALGCEVTSRRQSVTPSAKDFISETAALAHWREMIGKAASTLTGNVIRLGGKTAIEGNYAGRIKHSINAEWKRLDGRGHDELTAADMRRKYEWLQGINNALCKGDSVPAWLA